MAKRTKYTIRFQDESARFSNLRHALLFALMLSEQDSGYLIEVHAKDGLVGQYNAGKPTPEFEQHHINGIFR